MTRQRDIGRVLDAWLAPGPIEAPDRVLDILADRIAEVPQRRYPRAHTRFHAMTPPTIKFAAAAAILLAIGLAVGPLVTPGPNVATDPSPSPSPSAASRVVPESLVYQWVSLPVDDGDETTYDHVRLTVRDNGTMHIDDSSIQNGWASAGVDLSIDMRATEAGAGRLELTAALGELGCDEAPAATYDYALSPGGTKLTLAAVADACEERLAAMARDFQRIDCANPDDPCAGVLEAGAYHSVDFAPGSFPTTRAVGGLTVEVPDGWANHSDGPSGYGLVPAWVYDREDLASAQAYDEIDVWSRPAIASQADGCSWDEEPGIGQAVDDLVAFIVAHPGIVAEEPVTLTIDGHPATSIDIAMAPTWTLGCPDLGVMVPSVPLLTEAGERSDYVWGMTMGTDLQPNRSRLIFVDLGDGHVVSIWVAASTADRFDDFVEQAMPIVESMHFTP